jgi:hypothetical protein
MDFTKILKKEHADKWVAISKEKHQVIGFDSDLTMLDKKVGGEDISYMRVLPKIVGLQ